MKNILSVKDLCRSYERNDIKTDALHDVSFELKYGEILGIVGTSGSGKARFFALSAALKRRMQAPLFSTGASLGKSARLPISAIYK